MIKLLRPLLLLIVLSLWVGGISAPAAPADQPAKVYLTEKESLIFNLVNAARTKRGLRPLVADTTLTLVAREHSADMSKRNYFSHYSPPPNSRDPQGRLSQALGRTPQVTLAENIAYTSRPAPEHLHKLLMESKKHRKNLLQREFTRIGVGLYEDKSGGLWLTQMFCNDEASR